MASAILERLKQRGVSDSDLAYLERQEAKARRAEETQEALAEARQREAYLQGFARAGSRTNAEPDRIQKFLSKFDGIEGGEETKKLLTELIEVVREDVGGAISKKVEPLERDLGNLTAVSQLDAYLDTNMVPLYGEGIRDYWNSDLRAECLKRLRTDGKVVPELVAMELDRARVAQILADKDREDRKGADARTMDGFQSIQRKRASVETGRDAGSEDEATTGRDGSGRTPSLNKPFDPNAVAADVLRLMGKTSQ